jgi:hypothetical protein
MPDQGKPVRILLVRSWLHRLDPVRAVLRAAGFAPTFIRTDIEPAVHAALTRGGIDLVIFDPALDGLSRETVEAHCKELRPLVPLLLLGKLDDLAERVRCALHKTVN